MKKLLLVVDKSKAEFNQFLAEFIVNNYLPEEVEIEAVTVINDHYPYTITSVDKKIITKDKMPVFNKISSILNKYKVNKHIFIDTDNAQRIVQFAKDNAVDTIILTNPNKYNLPNFFVPYLVNHSGIKVLVLPYKSNYGNKKSA